MGSHEFELWIEEYKSQVKDAGAERPLNDSEIEKLNGRLDDIPDDYKSAFNLARRGNFSQFEKLPLLLRNYLGALELKEFRKHFGSAPSLENEDVRKYLESNAMNAALRAGISAEKNANDTREYATALDSYMNNIMMKRTMQTTTPEGRERLVVALGSERAEAAIQKNAARQLVMAKMMLLAQIGKYEVIDKNGLNKELDVPVYETIVHGSRTNFVLPAGENSAQVIDAFMGQNGGADAGIAERTAATHSVKRRKLGKSGELKSDSKEKRTYSPFKVFSNQYGMDLAVGGLGQNGPGGENDRILGEGESGHMYIRAEAGDSKYCGSLLIGIEGSAPQKDSYLGNSHSFLGKSAKQSAFLADKSIVGKKVGGRQVDLSGIGATDLSELLNTFSNKYTVLQQNATTPEGLEKFTKVNDMLMGKYMDARTLTDFLTSLDMTDKRLPEIISKSRGGYLSAVDSKGITDEEFKQSVRAKFSQEQACSIAEARFEYAKNAKDNWGLAVGAVKELMYTHETRSLGWKIRHPIKNLLEYMTIKDLTKRLATEMGYTPQSIANAFSFYNNTFKLDWGKDLSYDRATVDFSLSNRFKPTENKLHGVIRKVHDDIQGKLDTKDVGENEVASMNEDFKKMFPETYEEMQKGMPLDNNKLNREKIAINEASEANKRTGKVSNVIPPTQPSKGKEREI